MSPLAPSFRRVSSTTSRLIESYCSDCGLFIASSPAQQTLEMMEQLHRCQTSTEEVSREQVERLLRELSARETDLIQWIQSSERNTRWFTVDPMGAIRAANLGIDERTLDQLELITLSIAKKLRNVS
jgi:hypothetical protein